MTFRQFAMAALLAAAAGCGGIGNAQKQLRSAVDAKKPTLDQCYGAALQRNKETVGDMDLVIHVAEKTGQVEKVDVVRDGVGDGELSQCVQSALVGIGVDPKPKANLEISYTLQFTPSS